MARQNALKPIEDSHTQNFTAVVQVTFFSLCYNPDIIEPDSVCD